MNKPIVAGIPALHSLWFVECVSSGNVAITSNPAGSKTCKSHSVGLDLRIDLCSDPHSQRLQLRQAAEIKPLHRVTGPVLHEAQWCRRPPEFSHYS